MLTGLPIPACCRAHQPPGTEPQHMLEGVRSWRSQETLFQGYSIPAPYSVVIYPALIPSPGSSVTCCCPLFGPQTTSECGTFKPLRAANLILLSSVYQGFSKGGCHSPAPTWQHQPGPKASLPIIRCGMGWCCAHWAPPSRPVQAGESSWLC